MFFIRTIFVSNFFAVTAHKQTMFCLSSEEFQLLGIFVKPRCVLKCVCVPYHRAYLRIDVILVHIDGKRWSMAFKPETCSASFYDFHLIISRQVHSYMSTGMSLESRPSFSVHNALYKRQTY